MHKRNSILGHDEYDPSATFYPMVNTVQNSVSSQKVSLVEKQPEPMVHLNVQSCAVSWSPLHEDINNPLQIILAGTVKQKIWNLNAIEIKDNRIKQNQLE